MTLKEIYDFLHSFPNNNIILAHWGGGIFFYYLMKKLVQRGIKKHIGLILLASPYLYDKEIYSISTKIVGFDKILLGSDFPLIKPSRYLKEMNDAGLSNDAIGKICGENAASLLKIG